MVHEVVIGIFAGIGMFAYGIFIFNQVVAYKDEQVRKRNQTKALEELTKDGYLVKVNGVYRTRLGNEIKPQ